MTTLASRLDGLTLTRTHWFVIIATGVAMMFDGFDSQSLSFALPLILKEWHLTPALLGALASYSFVGLLLGSMLVGCLADRIGRRQAITLCVLVYALLTGACAFAPNYAWLAVFRFLTGLGIGGLIPVAAAWVAEFMPARIRAFVTSATISMFLLGWVVASAVAIAVIPPFGWRAIFLVGVVPALLAVVVQLGAPESPHWLLSRGRIDEAQATMRRLRGAPAAAERAPAPDVTPVDLDASAGPGQGWAELFGSRYRETSIILAILFFFIQIFGYGISQWLPTLLVAKGFTITKTYAYTLLINIGPVAGSFVMGWLLDVLGRRSTFVLFWLLAAVATILFAFANQPALIVVLGFGVTFFGISTNVCLDTITTEIYPTHLRASAVGWGLGVGRVGGILGPFLGGIILTLHIAYTGFFLIFALPLLINIVTSLPLRYVDARAPLEAAPQT